MISRFLRAILALFLKKIGVEDRLNKIELKVEALEDYVFANGPLEKKGGPCKSIELSTFETVEAGLNYFDTYTDAI